ncbi:MAG: amidohydrolase [Oscillospiraceae bacterium]
MNIEIKNAHVLLYEPDFRVVRQDLYIRDGVIAGVGAPPVGGFAAERVIDAAGKLVMPGLINCHTHLYMTLLRNYADDLRFDEWLFEKIMPKEDLITPEDAYWCNLLACLEMIHTGTTCFLDMHMFKEQSIAAAQQAGLRAVMSRGIVGEDAADEAGQQRIADTMAEVERAQTCGGMVRCMLGPHAIYTCGDGLLRHLVSVAKDSGLRMHIHLSETRGEVENCLKAHGCTPVAYLAKMGFFEVPTIAAHCVHLTDDDIGILAQHGVHVATNPVSNMKLGNGFAPVPKLLNAGVNVCVGTDGAASNNALNMFRELSMLSYIHKGVLEDPEAMPAPVVLQCGTANGARALGMEDEIGSIAVGKRADLIFIDMARPQLQPVNDMAAALVYAANGSEVDTVMVDGRVVMENGRVETMDEERIFYEVGKIRDRLLG